MASKNKKFVDDGWAFFFEGEQQTTIYLNDWINPKGNSFIDVSIKAKGIHNTKKLHIFVPFEISQDEIVDLSHHLNKENVFRATFNCAGIIDYLKNEYTSEIALNGRTLDVIHVKNGQWELNNIDKGTLITLDIEKLKPYIDNEEAYFIIRIPHKSLDKVLQGQSDVKTTMTRLRDLITSPVISENYVYQIRINEARMLPLQINKMGAFNRQRLKKSVVTLAVNERYEVDDHSCYKIRRIEENLYENFVPEGFKLSNVINYLWQEDALINEKGRFNFYIHLSRSKVGHGSMIIYVVLLTLFGVLSEVLWEVMKELFNFFE